MHPLLKGTDTPWTTLALATNYGCTCTAYQQDVKAAGPCAGIIVYAPSDGRSKPLNADKPIKTPREDYTRAFYGLMLSSRNSNSTIDELRPPTGLLWQQLIRTRASRRMVLLFKNYVSTTFYWRGRQQRDRRHKQEAEGEINLDKPWEYEHVRGYLGWR